MAKLNAFGSPGVYAISFQDEKFNPGTKIVEGSTGQRYASSYMGARSRWWDISAKQAAYEAGNIDAANKAVRAEIAAIQKARNALISDFTKRADTMARYNETAERDRLKFNAGIGARVTTTTFDREGRPTGTAGPVEGGERNFTIAKVVQAKLQSDTDKSPRGKSVAIQSLVQAGDLGADKYSQDMGAFYAIQMDAENASNRLQAQGVPREQADATAEAQVLKEYDAVPEGKNLANRYRFVKAQGEAQAGSGGPYDKTVVATSGKKALAERPGLKVDSIDPQLEALEAREKEARSRLQTPVTDLIQRTREIQREKFGPSITQSLRELPGQLRARRQANQFNRELRAIEQYLDAGGTVEELQSILAGAPTTAPAPVQTGISPAREPGRFLAPGMFEPPAAAAPASVRPVRVEPTITETTPVTGPVRVPPVRVQPSEDAMAIRRRQIVSEGEGFGIRDPFMFDLPSDESLPQMNLDEDLGGTELNAMPALQNMELTSPGKEAKDQPTTRKIPKDKPKQKKANPSDAEKHRGNLLQGFLGAASLLEKPKALDRKTANAESGSPQQFARAVIDAERAKSVSERLPLKELVANVAQQYNQMGDKAGRDSALENTVALYKLFLDEQSLLG